MYRFFNHLSIKWKINTIIVLISAVVLLLTGGASFFHYRSQYQRTILEELNSLAQLIGSNCDSAIVFDDPLAAAQVLASLKAKPEIVTAVIHGRSGAVFARYTRPGFTYDEIRSVPTENSHFFGPKYLELYHRVLLNNELIGTVYISHDLSRMQERFRGVLLLTALMVLLALCLALLLSSYFQRVVTDPLLHLTGVAESISREKDYSVRVDNPCFDEVGDLINTFNEMVAEIQKRDGFLEEQVQQRTGDLQQAIDVLKQEMDERKKAEQKISTSLKEKDVLLKEIHHRVKNNLSVISSLLDLQADKLQEPRVDEAFRECKNRIRSMALIHNNMYLSESLAEIDFQDYVKNLAETLCLTYVVQPEALAVHIAIDKVLLDIDKAIPCGLIINELFTNALKYAFPGGRPGAVSVAFKQDPESKLYELRFCDDGVGLPDELDVEQTESLGLRIVTLLTRQLCGTVQVIRGGGTEIVIQFGAV